MIRALSVFCVATTGLTLIAAHVSAQQAYPTQTYVTPAQAQPAFQDYHTQFHQNNWPNWYVGLSGQVGFVGDARVKGASTGDLTFSGGHAFTGAIGYRPYYSDSMLDNMRFELEGQYRNSELDEINNVSLDGDLTGYATMLNMYYDVYTGTQFTPYLGGGVGMIWWDLESPALAVDDVDPVMAWQLMGGFYYSPQSMPNTDWGLGYRYLGSGDPEFDNNVGGKIQHDYDAHNVELQARFRF